MKIETKLQLAVVLPVAATLLICIPFFIGISNTQPADEMARSMRQSQGFLAVILSIVLVIGTIMLLLRNILQGISNLIKGTRAVAKGDLKYEVDAQRKDELGELAVAFNSMTVNLREALEKLQNAYSQAVQQERYQASHYLSEGLIHNFNNALSRIITSCELLLSGTQASQNPEIVEKLQSRIHKSAKEIDGLVKRLGALLDTGTTDEARPLDLSALVRESVELTRPCWQVQAEAVGKQITIDTQLTDVPLIAGYAAELRSAVVNLIIYGVDNIAEKGRVTLDTRSEAGMVVLEVSDTGASDETARARCFEPLFLSSEKAFTSVGLASVPGIIEHHDGSIAVTSGPDQGTCFTLRFAIGSDEVGSAELASTPAGTVKCQILVVDDDADVEQLLSESLRMSGHTVDSAASGDEALEKLKTGNFQIVITDLALPGMSGDQLAATIKQNDPAMKVILLTGFGGSTTEKLQKRDAIDKVIHKPWTSKSLDEGIAQVLADQ